jgi:hypothetical protein
VTGRGDDAVARTSWEQVLAWRLKRQFLLERASGHDLVSVADRMGALHAQLMSSVELALWARTENLTRAAVADAMWRHRTLVKLWAMRKTLHVLPSSQLGLWLAGLGTYRDGPAWYGLNDPVLLKLARQIGTALHGTMLTRTELAAEIARLSGSVETADLIGGSWGSYLKPASMLGNLCFAPNRGRHVRFTHPDTWLPVPPARTEVGHALRAITCRYLTTCGPAAPVDLAAWWGVGRQQAVQMLTALGNTAARIDVEGETYWLLAEDVADLTTTAPVRRVVRLLPSFDPWVICACRRDRQGSRPGPGQPALDPARRTQIYRQQGWVSPVLLINGRIEGVWEHRRDTHQLHVAVSPFQPLPRWARLSVHEEVERLARYFDSTYTLAISD